jgi:homogentisate phytyltransferase/homogentisate geranylgeranyltransferase
LVVRGSLINLGFFLQAKASVLDQTLTAPTSLATLQAFCNQAWRTYPEAVVVTSFFAVFGVVIALMKDVPDIRGDTEYKIPSFSVKLGAARMFRYVVPSV